VTCIIGVAEEHAVWMGADSASSAGWTGRISCLPKVFRVGKFLIGYTTSFRMGQILQHHLSVRAQKVDESDAEYMVCGFAEAVRSCLKEHGFAKIENNVETGGQFLVGYKGRLYVVDTDFQVNIHADNFDAVGCGAQYALGAMQALSDKSPEERILTALEISAKFSNGVCGPFRVWELGAGD